jgi:predicted nucleic acid-binding protein
MLVDTSVWIDHFRRSNSALVAALERADVECHDFVLGEVACGTLHRRDDVLTLMQALPRLAPVPHGDVLALVSDRQLWGRGLGWVDVSLLAAALATRTGLWTLDGRLRRVAASLEVAREPV